MEKVSLPSNQEHTIDVLIHKNPALDRPLLESAVAFIAKAHKGQLRKSGMPYMEHPFEVAKILADFKLDTPAVLAGLLHDVVEDTEYSLEELETLFGKETAFMVDAVTKISAAQARSNKTYQKAETYRKLIAAMAENPQVIMIKIADRLHNMRTLNYMKPEKRKLIAQETLDIYVPLTHRFGLYRIKSELEDLSFKYTNPDEYQKIVSYLIESKEERESFINSKVIEPIRIKMFLEDFDCTIQGRTKNIYSIYNKTQRRKCDVSDIFDIFAVRIIVETVSECYLALGYIHNLWAPLQSRFKDYIATPKPNLYQSIHTTVIGNENRVVEVQIRTKDMDLTAEKGFAAHWAYKLETQRSGEELEWLNQMAKLQSEISDSAEFLEFLNTDLKHESITVFTPKGDSIELPLGATVLDFAFAIHTNLGFHCIGAKINNEAFGIDKELANGVTVQILKSPDQIPSPDWLEIVKSEKAKQELRRWMRSSMLRQAQILGKEIWERDLRLLRIPENRYPEAKAIIEHFKVPNLHMFYERLGQGEMPISALHEFLQPFASKENFERVMTDSPFRFLTQNPSDGKTDLPVEVGNDQNFLIHYATCCSPIPGDPIVGILVPKRGIEVHHVKCEHIKDYPKERLIAVEWNKNSSQSFALHLKIDTDNRNGITLDILSALNSTNMTLDRMSVTSGKYSGRIRLVLKAFRKEQVLQLMEKIQNISGVRRVVKS
ncbi:MAG: RelA/SpoT family protein [Fibrobacter sp.]|jgi:GTP pyrophosphokinase|nr:RelA/SpoT family protein [Fibrobacter sp.]